MNILSLYLRLVLAVAVACLLLGFVLPALFSARSSFAVLVGIGLGLAIPVAAWRWKDVARADMQMWKQLFSTKENSNEKD